MSRWIPFLLVLFAAGLSQPALGAESAAPDPYQAAGPETLSRLEDLHAQAEGMIAQNRFREAMDLYLEIILLEPDDETAYVNMGQINMLLGDYPTARECFANALDIDPYNEPALRGLQATFDPDDAWSAAGIGQDLEEEEMESVQSGRTASGGGTISVREADSFRKKVQKALQMAGVYTGPLDGLIGPKTRSAIKKFQEYRGLPVDGKVGPKTWEVLQTYLPDA